MLAGLAVSVDADEHVMAAFVVDDGYIPSDDAVTLEAGGAYLIDVLANDVGVPEGAGDRMLILVNPACGEAWREEGMVSYAVDPHCAGVQTLTYCVPAGDVCPSATLTVNVLPSPEAVSTSGADPTLTAGGAARDFTGESATPQFNLDDAGFAGGMGGGLPPMGGPAGGAGFGGGLASVSIPGPELGSDAPEPAPRRAEEVDDSVPALAPIAAVSGPGAKRKPQKPRSVYASPAIDPIAVQRPRRPGGEVASVVAPKADERGAVSSAPAERFRLSSADAVRRNSPEQPNPSDRSASLAPVGAQPSVAPYAFLSWGALIDHERGSPEKPIISPLAEFRELVSLSGAPATDWSLPEPEALAKVAALWGMESGWVVNVLREAPPASGEGASMEPLAGLIARKPVISAPDGFYKLVSLDPHGRHMRLTPASGGNPPEAEPKPEPQLVEPTEPAPSPIAGLTGRAAELSAAPEPDEEVRRTPLMRRPVAAAFAHPPLPFLETEQQPERQIEEPTEPDPDHLAAAGAIEAARTVLIDPEMRSPDGVAFRASAIGAGFQPVWPLSVDIAAVVPPALEPTQPLPPELVGWASIAAEMPQMRVTVNLTISGARDMPVRARRSFQTLAAEAGQPVRLAQLDQRPGDLNKGERTEPLPLNLRRLRTYPPLLSQTVRMTPDFYGAGMPRGGLRPRRFEELAMLGGASRPFAAFEAESAPRGLASDPNPPSKEEALAATLAAGLGPFVGVTPQQPRRPFEAAPAPAAPAWTESGASPFRLAAQGAGVQPALRVPEHDGEAVFAEAGPDGGTAAAATPTAPAGCAISSTAFPASGGMIQYEAVSPCRANQVAVVSLDDLQLAVRFDAEGKVAASIPGLAREQSLTITAADGESSTAPVTLLDIAGVQRVALTWDAPVDLNLHAFEFGAGLGDAGHVWEGSAVEERGYRFGKNGLLSSFPTIEGKGEPVEFYSFNPGRRSPMGKIVLAVEFASRGRTPEGDYCAGGAHASPEFRVHAFDRGVMDSGAPRIFEAAPCGVALDDANLYLKNLAQDILILNR